jgi:hypothetical protein
MDPVVPLTPGKPKHQAPPGPVTPLAAFTKPQHHHAAAVLFTPRKQQGQTHVTQSQPSPTPKSSIPSFPLRQSVDLSSDDSLGGVPEGIQRLDLAQSDSSISHSSETGTHEQKKKKKKGGALDVWHFFNKEGSESICKFCM